MGKTSYTRNFGYPCSDGRGLIEKETGKVAKQVHARFVQGIAARILVALSAARRRCKLWPHASSLPTPPAHTFLSHWGYLLQQLPQTDMTP